MQRPATRLEHQASTRKSPSAMLALSASRDCRSENVRILPVVIAELELGNIERHVFAAHFVERADHAALENRPEAFNGLGMDCANDILPSCMVNSRVWVVFVELIVARILISAKQADPVGNGFSHKGVKCCSLDVRDHSRNHITF